MTRKQIGYSVSANQFPQQHTPSRAGQNDCLPIPKGFPQMGTSFLDQPGLNVSPQLAKRIGLHEAIVVAQIARLLHNVTATRQHDGRRWITLTHQAWRRLYFPWWGLNTVRRLFDRLERDGLLIVRQFDLARRDRTNSYTLDPERLAAVLGSHDHA